MAGLENHQPKQIAERISAFKASLTSDSLSIVREHIIFGECFLLDTGTQFRLKALIAKEFGIHPSEIVTVGSAQLGFSIVKRKRYQPFGDTSDLDLAIVAPTFFDSVWREVFLYDQSGAFWADAERFKTYLFRGWIRPDLLPRSDIFTLRNKWFEFFQALTGSRQHGSAKINAALYKSWDFLEYYQEINVKECQRQEAGEL